MPAVSLSWIGMNCKIRAASMYTLLPYISMCGPKRDYDSDDWTTWWNKLLDRHFNFNFELSEHKHWTSKSHLIPPLHTLGWLALDRKMVLILLIETKTTAYGTYFSFLNSFNHAVAGYITGKSNSLYYMLYSCKIRHFLYSFTFLLQRSEL